MKDFHMGYDLLNAGYNYFAANESNEKNTELINGIANDFFEASIAKAGIAVNKEEIIYRICDAEPLVSETPILILYVTNEKGVSVKFTNKMSPLYKKLFDED